MRVGPWACPKLLSTCEAKRGVHTRTTLRRIEDSPVLGAQTRACVFKMVIQGSIASNVAVAFSAVFPGGDKGRA